MDKLIGSKGSKLLIQQYINGNVENFNQQLLKTSPSLLSFVKSENNIIWYSPLKEFKYKEYKNDFLSLLEDGNSFLEQLKVFWPSLGPQWDGIALVEDSNGKKGIILVEAKAHVKEMKSKIRASSLTSIAKIETTISNTINAFQSNAEPEIWLNEYYQLANRLAFLYLLNDKLKIPTWLVLCNFVEDQTHISTSLNEWLGYYKEVYNKLDLDNVSSPLFNRIITIYPPAQI